MSAIELRHDPSADAIAIYFSRLPWDRTEVLDDARNIDYAADGTVIGIELLYVSDGVDVSGLPQQSAVAELLRKHGIRVNQAA